MRRTSKPPLSALLLVVCAANAKPMYDGGDWSSLWWLPTQTSAEAKKGTQVMIESPIPHLMFLPPGDPPAGGWPMLVFLHGQGESSPTPLANVALQGPPQHAGRHPHAMGFAVLSPQKPMSAQFFDEEVASAIADAIGRHAKLLPIDASRIYLTGVSQGGIGTWGMASDPKYVDLFAAIAPVCGGFPDRPNKRAEVLRAMPVYAFHGENDSILPVGMSDEAVAALGRTQRTAAAGEPKYERIGSARSSDYSWVAAGVPDMEGHASWVHAYYPPGLRVGEQPPLYQWLLTHRKAAKSPIEL